MKQKTFLMYSLVGIPLLALGAVGIGAATVAAQEAPTLSEEQTAIMDEARDLHEQGLHSEAQALMEETGLPLRRNMRMRANKALHEAIANNDYDAFVAATTDAPFADQVSPEFFEQMCQAHALREAGDFEGARAIMDELGLKPPHGPGRHCADCANDTE